jgi:hypothetical protein
VSGARTSTVLQRLPFLPAADAIIAENGEYSSSSSCVFFVIYACAGIV